MLGSSTIDPEKLCERAVKVAAGRQRNGSGGDARRRASGSYEPIPTPTTPLPIRGTAVYPELMVENPAPIVELFALVAENAELRLQCWLPAKLSSRACVGAQPASMDREIFRSGSKNNASGRKGHGFSDSRDHKAR